MSGCNHCFNGYVYSDRLDAVEFCECSTECAECGRLVRSDETIRGCCGSCAAWFLPLRLSRAEREFSTRLSAVVAATLRMPAKTSPEPDEFAEINAELAEACAGYRTFLGRVS